MSMLGGLVLVTGAATDLVISVSRSSRSIGDSEIAYFAAETAVERALLAFEKQGASLGALNTASTPLPGNSAANYTTSATMETKAPPDDTRLQAENDASAPLSTSNRLMVLLPQGKTFYFDLATNGAMYPTNMEIDFANGMPATAIVYASGAQSTTAYAGTGGNSKVTVPTLGYTSGTRVKVQNTSSSASANPITIKPTGGDLPIGVLITGVGRYRGVERRIEVFRPNYVIY